MSFDFSWKEECARSLDDLKEKNLLRVLRTLSSAHDARVVVDGRSLLQFSSNSYLSLGNDPRVKARAKEAIDCYGTTSGASRLVSGNLAVHEELERTIAALKNTRAALAFSSGFAANIGTIAALASSDWTIFCDRLNHASIIDGCRASGAKLVIYRHSDMNDLEGKIRHYAPHKGMIVSDSVFSMDGDIAPLPELVALSKQYNLPLMIDDAHATGVIGKNGAGSCAHFNCDGVAIQMGTLSKALGSEGGFIAGDAVLIDYLINSARSFIFSTALAPANAAAASASLDIIKEDDSIRERLLENSALLRSKLRTSGFSVPEGITPIIPVLIGDAERTVAFSRALLDEGIFVPAIRPPTVPPGGSRLRITLMAAHTSDDCAELVMTMERIAKKMGLLL